MKKIVKILFLNSLLFFFHPLYAIPNNDHPTTFFIPLLHAGFTSLLTDESGYSFAGDFHPANLRASGSLGLNIFTNQRLKFSGEYLWQRINYAFFSGNQHTWVNQGALGMTYQYDLYRYSFWQPQFNINAYYANAASAALGTATGSFINNAGLLQPFSNTKRIADSHASGISPGFTMQAWRGGKVGLDLNYDNVRYNMKYQSDITAKGFGGTAYFEQQLTDQIAFGGSAAIRQPFNHYQADLGWRNIPYLGDWIIKISGAYIIGKESLPTTYNIGLSADYFLDRACDYTVAEKAKNALMDWIVKPAVYMPEVLGIVDQSVTS